MQVFVYGALMADERLVGRPGVVTDYALRFSARGLAVLEPRFLALESAPGEVAHGLVADVDASVWQEIAAHEDGYVEDTVEVVVDGQRQEAVAWVLQPEERAEEAWPSGRYADVLVRGAVRSGLPEDVVARYREAARRGSPYTRWVSPAVRLVKALVPYVGFPGAVVVVVVAISAGVSLAAVLCGLLAGRMLP